MKKLTALLLIAILAFGLCACGAEDIISIVDETIDPSLIDTAAIRSNYDKASAFIEAAIDTSDLTFDEQDDEGGTDLYKSWYSSEEAGEAKLSKTFEINGKSFEIAKTTLKDVKAMGFEINEEDRMVEADMSITTNASMDGKDFYLTLGSNETGKETALDDMVVFGFSTLSDEYFLPFGYCGLSRESTIKDIIDALGKPNDTIRLEANEYFTEIEVSYYNDSIKDNVGTSDKVDITLKYDPATDSTSFSQITVGHDVYSSVPDEE